jgi:hypothetical protein
MTRREVALINARVAGYHDDARSFTRLRIESRVAIAYLNEQWRLGQKMKAAGVPCTCTDCKNNGATT